jgi:hypothetical protein
MALESNTKKLHLHPYAHFLRMRMSDKWTVLKPSFPGKHIHYE